MVIQIQRTAGNGITAGYRKYRTRVITGTVFAGTGTVWEIPTRGIPVTNPTHNGLRRVRVRVTHAMVYNLVL